MKSTVHQAFNYVVFPSALLSCPYTCLESLKGGVAIFLHVFFTLASAEIRKPDRRLITISRLPVVIVLPLKICCVFLYLQLYGFNVSLFKTEHINYQKLNSTLCIIPNQKMQTVKFGYFRYVQGPLHILNHIVEQDRSRRNNLSLRCASVTIVVVEKQEELHILSVCLQPQLSSMQSECAILCHLWPLFLQHTLYYLINDNIFGKKLLNIKCVF